MKDVTPAMFTFEGYKIKKFSYRDPAETPDSLQMAFYPSGRFLPTIKTYELNFDFTAKVEGEVEDIITASLVATFKFETDNLDAIPSFFYRNCIAIVFPYLRAFISTLTLQAQVRIYVIPILNLSVLEQTLKENTVLIPF